MKTAARQDVGVRLKAKFNDITRQDPSGREITFGMIESAMFKNRQTVFPKMPATRNEYVELLKESSFKDHLVGEVLDENGLVLAVLFSNPNLLENLQLSEEVGFDATFHSCPKMFYQLMNIFIVKQNRHFFPAFCVLMANKTEALYDAVFNKLGDLIPDFHPQKAMSDFEKASRNAFKKKWPVSDMLSCYFHFSQAILKRVRKEGLIKLYEVEKSEFHKWVRAMRSLPLLPKQHILSVFEILEQKVFPDMTSINKKKTKKFKKYVRKNWMPATVLETLSVFGEEFKTNNGAESWHAKLKEEFPKKPKLWHFTKKLGDLLADSQLDIERLALHGQISRPQKRKVKANMDRRKLLEIQLTNGQKLPIQYLHAVAHTGDYSFERVPADVEEIFSSDNDSDDEEAVHPENVGEIRPNAHCICCLGPRVRTYCLVPCGHALFCEGCANSLKNRRLCCPTCRANIAMVIRAYID